MSIVQTRLGCGHGREMVKLESAASLAIRTTSPCRIQRLPIGSTCQISRAGIGPPPSPRICASSCKSARCKCVGQKLVEKPVLDLGYE